MLDDRGKLALAEVAVYVPAFVFCLWPLSRDESTHRFGWICLSLFCLGRLGSWISQPSYTFESCLAAGEMTVNSEDGGSRCDHCHRVELA